MAGIKRPLLILLALSAMTLSTVAHAAITLYDKEGTTVSTDASFNTFYVYSHSDNDIAGTTRDQSRVKMGFLPNWIGFNFSREAGNLKLGGRSSFWVTINDSDSNLTETGIDVRQFYGTVDAAWGQVLFGKDFTLFNRSNIFLDEILLGFGNVSDTLGLIDGTGVSFGNIGTGYTYPFPSAQITYRSPELVGFKLAVGVIDPSRTATDGEEAAPRFEGELTYQVALGDVAVNAWGGWLLQSSESDTGDDVDSRGFSYGVRAKFMGLALQASGFTAEGVGFLLNPGADTTLGLPVTQNGDEVDSNGYLLQASYQIGPSRIVASYGKNELDADPKWENETATGAYFHAINDYLLLVAEYNRNTISIGDAEEQTDTIALGAVLNF